MWVAVVFLLLFPHHRLALQYPPQNAGDRSDLGPSAFLCTGCRTLLEASSAFPPTRISPLELFIIHSEFLITDNVDPPWLDHRGPPGTLACSRTWVRYKAAATQNFPTPYRKTNDRFFNRLTRLLPLCSFGDGGFGQRDHSLVPGVVGMQTVVGQLLFQEALFIH